MFLAWRRNEGDWFNQKPQWCQGHFKFPLWSLSPCLPTLWRGPLSMFQKGCPQGEGSSVSQPLRWAERRWGKSNWPELISTEILKKSTWKQSAPWNPGFQLAGRKGDRNVENWQSAVIHSSSRMLTCLAFYVTGVELLWTVSATGNTYWASLVAQW